MAWAIVMATWVMAASLVPLGTAIFIVEPAMAASDPVTGPAAGTAVDTGAAPAAAPSADTPAKGTDSGAASDDDVVPENENNAKRGPVVDTRDILVDPATGLALAGYDPVAYFVDRRPRRGKERYEYFWSGVVWRFLNQGNLAAFAAEPEVYAPRYGGYDPLALAAGTFTHGNPAIWAAYDNRLYLFFSSAHRFRWLSSPDYHLKGAGRVWAERNP